MIPPEKLIFSYLFPKDSSIDVRGKVLKEIILFGKLDAKQILSAYLGSNFDTANGYPVQSLISQIPSLVIWTPVSACMREIDTVYNFPNQIKMSEPLPPYTDVLTLLYNVYIHFGIPLPPPL